MNRRGAAALKAAIDLPQPKAGDGVVFCTHLVGDDGLPRFAGGTVIQILPDQMLAPDELPHEWLVVCRACKAKKDVDPHAPIAGFHWDWPEGARLPY